ncbi:unnamed protein product [Leuciscus chuanchicus]
MKLKRRINLFHTRASESLLSNMIKTICLSLETWTVITASEALISGEVRVTSCVLDWEQTEGASPDNSYQALLLVQRFTTLCLSVTQQVEEEEASEIRNSWKRNRVAIIESGPERVLSGQI